MNPISSDQRKISYSNDNPKSDHKKTVYLKLTDKDGPTNIIAWKKETFVRLAKTYGDTCLVITDSALWQIPTLVATQEELDTFSTKATDPCGLLKLDSLNVKRRSSRTMQS
jgi:hypothetical protein